MNKYKFDWTLVGNVQEGRPNLGDSVGVDIYRLMQFTLRDVLEQKYGTQAADKIFFDAGKLAGKEFYAHNIAPVHSIEEFVRKTQQVLREKRVGILRIEESRVNEGKVILTIDEDLDCSGLPEIDYETCIYDEGFVSSLFECFTREEWTAKEIDCWCTGARTCRFLVTQK